MNAASLRRQPTEDSFTRMILTVAALHGWRRHHGRPGRAAGGWRTPVAGDVGFPDLVLVKPGRLILAELKVTTTTTPDQRLWLELFRTVPGVEVYEWRPRDWPAIEATLRGSA